MQGDFSRYTFDPKKHYSAVLMQQGRVQLDADWNEQQAINQYRIQIETQDIIGACGVPVSSNGFELKFDQEHKDFYITPGRIYVDGVLCENEGAFFTQQPHLTNQSIPKNPGIYLAYLDVWQRHITKLDDPRIREVALGGPDTATRLQTVWQVKFLPINSTNKKETFNFLRKLRGKLKEVSVETSSDLISASIRDIDEFLEEFINLPDESFLQGLQSFLPKLASKLQDITYNDVDLTTELQQLRQIIIIPTCNAQYSEWTRLTTPSTGRLNARTRPTQNPSDPCLLPPSAGYQRLENQLYRVEIHQGGNLNTATFKWSRDNGSVVTAIRKIDSSQITVQDIGPDDVLRFAVGQWVEIIGDHQELNGQPGQIAQIRDVNAATCTITVEPVPTSIPIPDHPKLRRWDNLSGTQFVTIPTDNEGWIPLEDGIEVKFSEDTYRSGDYWLIPARTATSEIEWSHQVSEEGREVPIPQLPLGIQHHYCRLALLELNTNNDWQVFRDCRRPFHPLNQAAIHVVDINWKNDDVWTLENFRDGLWITLDAAPVQQNIGIKTITSATMIVTLEVPWGYVDSNNTADAVFILDGDIEVSLNRIHWSPRGVELRDPQQGKPISASSKLIQGFLVRERGIVRILLKGHFIWSDNGDHRVYLDGQSFGVPGLRSDNQTPRVDLLLPSGSDTRASDFESWFYLKKLPLRVSNIRFLAQDAEENQIVKKIDLPPFPLSPEAIADKRADLIEIRFNRAVRSSEDLGQGQNIWLEVLDSEGSWIRSPGIVTGNVGGNTTLATFTPIKDGIQHALSSGSYRLIILGSGTNPVVAEDDDTLLDGDFDDQPGGDFILPFQIVLALKHLSLNPNRVLDGSTSVGTVQLDGTAPENIVVTLSSDNDVAQVPFNVTIQPGNTEAKFSVNIKTRPFPNSTADITVTITASFAGTELKAKLIVEGTPG